MLSGCPSSIVSLGSSTHAVYGYHWRSIQVAARDGGKLMTGNLCFTNDLHRSPWTSITRKPRCMITARSLGHEKSDVENYRGGTAPIC